MIIMPPHRRTIYIQYFKTNIPPWDKIKIVKYTLNIPKLQFIGQNDKFEVVAINEDNVPCHPPFPNICPQDNTICYGNSIGNKLEIKDAVNEFFTKPFTPAYYYKLDLYLNQKLCQLYNDNDADQNQNYTNGFNLMHQFYTNWQNTGKLKLIPIEYFNHNYDNIG